VAVKDGKIVAGTSTGGLSGKWPGRIGDSPVFGAGTYADDRACGVSCTGTGELFLRHCVAHDITARMRYSKIDVESAAKATMAELPDEDGGVGGIIALDAKGQAVFVMSPKCAGMYRGYVTADGEIFVAIFKDDTWTKLVIPKTR
jgi:L-asparaginase / beta-aspartyl-peptidase